MGTDETTNVTIKMPTDLLRRLQAHANDRCVGRALFINHAVSRYCDLLDSQDKTLP